MTLREARKTLGWTQTRLAADARMSVALLCYAEGGRFHLSASQAARVAKALRMDPARVEELRVATRKRGNPDSVGEASGG